MFAVLLSILTFASTLFGGLFALRNRHRLHYIMSFTAGVLIAVCFFDIMPEIFKIAQENNLDPMSSLIAIVVGFLAIHVLEKTARIHGSHEEEYASHKHPRVGLINASGLSFHSFLDGVGIGLGFQVSEQVGFVVALAVIAHDFSDGLNTVTLMLSHKNTIRRSIVLLIVDAIAPVLGVLSTFLFKIPETALQLYLGFFIGFLLYIGASDLLPEAHSEHSSFRMIGLTILGAAFIFLVTRFT
ncbi:ZIP family metal transporter [Candidatus Curtissbacteria bacterium]|nr:ZIP family metal transporter [Candidatus Curtissbacteria bacterium]